MEVSPLCNANQAFWLLYTGAHEAAFQNIKTIAECLADELINRAKGSFKFYAIKKKDSWSMWPSPNINHLAVTPINLFALWGGTKNKIK